MKTLLVMESSFDALSTARLFSLDHEIVAAIWTPDKARIVEFPTGTDADAIRNYASKLSPGASVRAVFFNGKDIWPTME